MEEKQVPRYYGFRIYLSANLLHFFLIIPFTIFIFGQRIPEIAKNKGFLSNDSTTVQDSLHTVVDSLHATVDSLLASPEKVDSLIDEAISRGADAIDGELQVSDPGGIFQVEVEDEGKNLSLFDKEGALNKFFRRMFYLTLLSYLLGLIYNIPFKRLFKNRRRNGEISPRLLTFCKRQILHSHLVNALIVISPSLVVITISLFTVMIRQQAGTDLETEAFREFFYLTLIATFLEFVFVYYWQRHRVRQYYIEHAFSPQELRRRVDKGGAGKIRSRLVMASTMTTLLPLLVVLFYLILSLTRINDLELTEITRESWNILLGPWGSMDWLSTDLGNIELENIGWMSYVNAADTLSMFIGISMGIMVSIIYLVLFIRWTNRDITHPVRELLANMRDTRGGEANRFTLVRTNDEIGELAEGYNEMTLKIREHVEHISTLNRELESKVEERTREVVNQKEEIEAQKEEIEAQLDLTTHQRDTIGRQNDQILDSIRYAERIQSAILPPHDALSDAIGESFVLYLPRDIVSGDYYWISRVKDRLLLAAADCTGHGVPGAFLSVLGISSMNEIVNGQGLYHPDQVLDQLRTIVISSLHQSGIKGETQDGIELALCMIDLKEMRMEFAGANRPLYMVRTRQGKNKLPSHELVQVKGDRMPIGIYEQEPGPFANKTIDLEKGDTLYLFSDGYVDQLGGPRRKTYRSIHFRNLLLKIQNHSMEEQKKILLEEHHAWRGENEQIDDILIIGIRI